MPSLVDQPVPKYHHNLQTTTTTCGQRTARQGQGAIGKHLGQGSTGSTGSPSKNELVGEIVDYPVVRCQQCTRAASATAAAAAAVVVVVVVVVDQVLLRVTISTAAGAVSTGGL